MSFAKKLKDLRKERNVSQKIVADQLNLSINSFSQYELGNTEPNLENLKKIADFFYVSVDYLLSDSPIKVEKNGAPTAKDLSADEWQLVKAYREIDIYEREVILKQLRALALTVKK